MIKSLLAGDIGGTKTILKLVEDHSTIETDGKISLNSIYEQTYSSKEYIDLVPLVMTFLEEAKQTIEKEIIIERACFGIAGPIVNNTSELTNLSWSLTGDRLARDLAIEQVSLINDFEAIGYGVLGLKASDIFTIQEVEINSSAPIAIIGPGTGLGQGFLIPSSEGKYRVFSSEGGHADFAPRSHLEFQLLKYLQDKFNLERISVERVVSGPGIISIYQFLRDRQPHLESNSMTAIYQRWQTETIDLAAEIAIASQNEDYLCEQTMKIFAEAYGAEAGNLALKLLPYGGLYLAGGITGKNLSLMKQKNFINSFLHKGRMRPILAQIPIYVILNPKVGLIGAAVRALQL